MLRYIKVIITTALTSPLFAYHESNHSFCMLVMNGFCMLFLRVKNHGSVMSMCMYIYIYASNIFSLKNRMGNKMKCD